MKMHPKKRIFGVALFITSVMLVFTLSNLRDFGSPVSDMDDYFIKNGQKETGANNIVSSVVFDYRGFDTLGEATVLFAAVLGIGVLLERRK